LKINYTKMKNIFLSILLISSFIVSAQRNKDANYIGLSFGLNQLNLNSSNFKTKALLGYQGGLAIRGNFYNDFDMVVGMQFSETKFSVQAKDLTTSKINEVEYKLPGVQISVQPSYKIIENHLSVELGPVLQINGKLKYDKSFENNVLVDNTNLNADQITDVSKFNFNVAFGVTAGVKHVRANLQYQLGINNLLSKLNDQDILNKPSFDGKIGILSGNIIVYF
jgi:hypothetical protein